MVDPDVFSNLAETKPFEASLGDSVERRTDQLRTSLVAVSTNHLVDFSRDAVSLQACRVTRSQRSVEEVGQRNVSSAAIPTWLRYVITVPQACRRVVSV